MLLNVHKCNSKYENEIFSGVNCDMVYLLFQWDLLHLEAQLPKNGCLWYLHILHHLQVVLVHNCSLWGFNSFSTWANWQVGWRIASERRWRGGKDEGLWGHKGGTFILVCCITTSMSPILREELLKHTSKHTKQHLCEECHKSYASKYNLNAHIEKFHWGVTGVFHCTVPGCTVTLKNKRGFYKHYNREHKDGFCNKIFAGVNELEDHECSAKSVTICKFCQKKFHRAQICKRHIGVMLG